MDMTDVEEQRRLRSRVRTQRHRNRSSDDVRALRRQADRERKRAARQQATDTGATVADLGFHEGGFVRSGALARPRKFLETTPTSGQKPRPLRS